jgi:hypothetical protein
MSALCAIKLLIQKNLIKCSGGTCCFQIDIQGSGWPQAQNSEPGAGRVAFHRPAGLTPAPELSVASSLNPNHQDTRPGGEGCLSRAVLRGAQRKSRVSALDDGLRRTPAWGLSPAQLSPFCDCGPLPFSLKPGPDP